MGKSSTCRLKKPVNRSVGPEKSQNRMPQCVISEGLDSLMGAGVRKRDIYERPEWSHQGRREEMRTHRPQRKENPCRRQPSLQIHWPRNKIYLCYSFILLWYNLHTGKAHRSVWFCDIDNYVPLYDSTPSSPRRHRATVDLLTARTALSGQDFHVNAVTEDLVFECGFSHSASCIWDGSTLSHTSLSPALFLP